MGSAESAGRPAMLRVAVAASPRRGEAIEVALTLPAPATAADALRASGLVERFPELDPATATVGIWGRRATIDAPLRDGDRVELYRPLVVDPKEARRARARGPGAARRDPPLRSR